MLVWLLGVQALGGCGCSSTSTRALAAAEAAEETARLQAAPNPLLLALSVRAAIHHDRGEPRRGRARRRRLRRADRRPRAERDDPDGRRRRSPALHVADDPERCLAELDAARARPVVGGPRPRCVRVRAALAAGRLDDADRFARAAAAARRGRHAPAGRDPGGDRHRRGAARPRRARSRGRAGRGGRRRPPRAAPRRARVFNRAASRAPHAQAAPQRAASAARSTPPRRGSCRAARSPPRARPRPPRPSSSGSRPTRRAAGRGG